jgi:hypothetical protein
VNAYHSEVHGCHAGLLGLLAFSIFHKVQGGEVAFGFNNDACVDKAAAGHLNISAQYKHSDLVHAIRRIVYKLKADHSITVTFFQVAGHQDHVVPYEQLTQLEQLSYEMDIHAKARVDRRFQAQAPPPPKTIKFEGWSCWIDEAKMMTNPADPLLYQIHKALMKDFLS